VGILPLLLDGMLCLVYLFTFPFPLDKKGKKKSKSLSFSCLLSLKADLRKEKE
jgi:hypothetical protein